MLRCSSFVNGAVSFKGKIQGLSYSGSHCAIIKETLEFVKQNKSEDESPPQSKGFNLLSKTIEDKRTASLCVFHPSYCHPLLLHPMT
jgi:hypothetical protein